MRCCVSLKISINVVKFISQSRSQWYYYIRRLFTSLGLYRYFNASSRLDTASWTTAEEDALSPCGHCDNCTRDKEAAKTEDVTVAAWRILTIVETVHKERGRVTLSQLADMARGLGNGEFKVPGRGKRSKGTTSSLDKDSLDGEVVKLSKEVRLVENPSFCTPCSYCYLLARGVAMCAFAS